MREKGMTVETFQKSDVGNALREHCFVRVHKSSTESSTLGATSLVEMELKSETKLRVARVDWEIQYTALEDDSRELSINKVCHAHSDDRFVRFSK